MSNKKNRGLKSSILFCTLFFTTIAFNQAEIFSPKGSFSIDLGVPASPKNQAFGSVMEGLFNGGIDYRYNLFNGWTIGGGVKYSFFTINSFIFNNTAISGGYQMPGAYILLGYEKFTTERVSFTGSVRAGYSLLMSFNDSCAVRHGGQHISESIFIEPQIEMVMLTEKISPHGFSLVLGYSFYFNEFDKEEICIDEISTLPKESYEGITRFLSIGFGYRYYLGRN